MRISVFVFLFISVTFSSIAQTTPNDTATFPYWIEMMQDRHVNLKQTQRAFETYWLNRPIEKSSGYKPFKRWEYTMEREADANGNLPDYQDLYDAIYQYYDSLAGNLKLTFGSAPCLTTGKWIEIGPKEMPGNRTSQPNGMGRVNAIAFHPTDSNILWIGAPAGGLWKSTDRGSTWESNTDTMPTLGVSAIAINPKNPDVIYIGTGDRDASDAYSRGVMKSTDGGKSWKWANATMGNATVGRLIMDPLRPDTLFAATSSGIYRTTNGASTWTNVQSGGFFKDIVYKPGSNDTIYATRNGLFFRSLNKGLTWSQITSGIPSTGSRGVIAVTPSNPEFVYFTLANSSTFNSLCLSVDGGSNFKVKSTTPNILDYSELGSGTGGQAWYDLDMAADPFNASTLYVGGVNIFKSTDSGSTWKINAHWVGTGAPAIHADQHVLEYAPNGKGLYAGHDGGIHETYNGGSTWTDISQGLGISQIYRLGQSATQKDMLINGYQDNGTGLMENGKWFTVMGGDGMDCTIDPTDATWAYSDLYYGDIRRYKNGSYNARIAANGTNGITESGAWVTPFILQEGDPNTMFIGYKNIWRSNNVKAATSSSIVWTKISNNLAGSNSQNVVFLENSIADPDILYFSRGDSKLFVSNDISSATPTWTDLTANLPASGTPVWIETHPKLTKRVFIILGNKIYQSDNGGNSWNNISTGLPSVNLLSVVLDTSSKKQGMYLGTYMGVFYKDTTMSGWSWFNSGMPVNTRVTDVEIFYHPSGRSQSHVVASTYGRGNWRSHLYDEDPKPPIAGFKNDLNHICSNQIVRFADTSLNSPTQSYWKITPSGFTYEEGTDSNSQNPVIRFNQKGTYTVKLYSANCKGTDSIEKTNLIQVEGPITPVNCSSYTKYTNANYTIGIFQVKLDTMTHDDQGTYPEGAYVDLTCNKILTLKNDTTYFMSVKTGVNYKENVKVFIDFNDNGNLNDGGERVFMTPKQMTFHSDSVRIPKNAVLNKLLRMRVMSDYDTVLHACDSLSYGQTEDFGVVIVSRYPEPNFYTDNYQICAGSTVTFYDSSIGNVFSYDWNFGAGASPAFATGKGPHVVQYASAGFKKVKLSLNGNLVSLVKNTAVEVIESPRLNLSQTLGSSTLCEGQAFMLKALDSSNTATNFNWFKNNKPFNPAIDSMLLSNSCSSSDSGSYFITKSYNGCTDTSDITSLKIYPTPVAFPNALNDTQCLNKYPIQFNANATVSWGALNYLWNFKDGQTSNQINPTHPFTAIGNYMVDLKIISPFGCAYHDSFLVVINATPHAEFNMLTPNQCLNENLFTCNNKSSIIGNDLTYFWDFGDLTTDTATNPVHHFSRTGTFKISLIASSPSQCYDTFTSLIDIFPNPVAGIAVQDTGQCFQGNSFLFSSTSKIHSGYSITENYWDYGDGKSASGVNPLVQHYADTGIYTVRLISESAEGCVDTTFRTIIVYPNPKASFSVNDSAQCFKYNLFHLTETSSNDVINSWFTFNYPSIELPPLSRQFKFNEAGNINAILHVTNKFGCLDSTSKTLKVLESPTMDFDVAAVCLEESTNFNNKSTPGTYTWFFGDGAQSSLKNPTHMYTHDDTYNVSLEVVLANGCKDTLFKTAIVHPKPIASFEFTSEPKEPNVTLINFLNASSNAVNYLWNFGILGMSNQYSPTLSVTDSASFEVMLIASNIHNCTDTAKEWIVIFPQNNLIIPDAFTPNKDNLNDIFKPYGIIYAKDYELLIYSRWGELVFKTTNPKQGWDGNYKGSTALPGIYMYVINITDYKDEKIKTDGTIQLIR